MNVTAIVLAAGRSERMGTLKSMLHVGEARVIDRVLSACQAASRTIVVGSEALPAPRTTGELLLLINDRPERGPISSLQIALASDAHPADHYLMFPVDYPLVERSEVAALIEAAAARRARVVVPVCRGRRGHPVLFAGALAAELLAVAPGRTARDVLGRERADVVELGTEHEGVLIDMDTPFDFGRVDALARRREVRERLQSTARPRIALGRKGGVLSQDVHPGPSSFTVVGMKLDGGLSEEWQVHAEREFAAAILVRTLATAFLIATSGGKASLRALSDQLARNGCRELVVPSMNEVEAGAGEPLPWQPYAEVDGLRLPLPLTLPLP